MATENNNKTLNVPNLRFPEFNGEWERSSLGVVFCKVENGLTYDPNNSEGLPVTRIETISDRSINYKRVGYAKDDGKLSKYKMEPGDILFSHINSLKHIGKTAYYDGEHPLYHGMNLLLLRTTNEESARFLFYQLNTSRFLHRCQVLANQAVNQASINTRELKGITLHKPSIKEQIKIADFISLLDNHIATQIKIIEKLESLIKGLCQKLTQQDNPNTALNDTLVCYSSTLQESSVQEAGDYPVYGATGVCGYTDTPEVDGDSILIIKDGASVGVTYYASGKYSAIGTLNRLAAKRGYSLRYLYYCLKVFNFAPYRTGLAIPHIYFRDYGKAKVWCPSLDEQQRIADALSKVELKIAIEKSLLEQLYSQKRFLLQAMFI